MMQSAFIDAALSRAAFIRSVEYVTGCQVILPCPPFDDGVAEAARRVKVLTGNGLRSGLTPRERERVEQMNTGAQNETRPG